MPVTVAAPDLVGSFLSFLLRRYYVRTTKKGAFAPFFIVRPLPECIYSLTSAGVRNT